MAKKIIYPVEFLKDNYDKKNYAAINEFFTNENLTKSKYKITMTKDEIYRCQNSIIAYDEKIENCKKYEEFFAREWEETWEQVTSKEYVSDNFKELPSVSEFEEAIAAGDALCNLLTELKDQTESFREGKFFCVTNRDALGEVNSKEYFSTKKEIADYLLACHKVNLKNLEPEIQK